jgi:hypothetical protein
VELLFAHTYLLLFGKLAVGGLAALAVPPFTQLERGFYKSTAAVYLFCAYAMAAGDTYLWLVHPERTPVNLIALATWVAFCALFTGYFATLYVELPFLRARLFPASIFCGIAALAVTAAAYVPAGVGAAAVLVFVIPAIAGAAIVGAGLTGMLLGHWYLIDTGLDLAPFRSILVYCRACLIAEVVSVAAAAAILALWPGTVWEAGFAAAFSSRFVWLVIARLASWALAAVILELIRRTLEIPQTMAATGLFYIAALVIAVGQIAGHWLLFRTGLPL